MKKQPNTYIPQEFNVSKLDQDGREIPMATQPNIPVGFRKPETIAEQVARLVKREVSAAAAEAGMDTFEDYDDFDIDGMIDDGSAFELEFDQLTGKEMYRAEKQFLDLQRAEFDRLAQELKAAQKKARRDAKQPASKPAAGDKGDSK